MKKEVLVKSYTEFKRMLYRVTNLQEYTFFVDCIHTKHFESSNNSAQQNGREDFYSINELIRKEERDNFDRIINHSIRYKEIDMVAICYVNDLDDLHFYKRYFKFPNLKFYFRTWFIGNKSNMSFSKIHGLLSEYSTVLKSISPDKYKRSFVFPNSFNPNEARFTKQDYYKNKDKHFYFIAKEEDYKVIIEELLRGTSGSHTYYFVVNNYDGNTLSILNEFALISQRFASNKNEFILQINYNGKDLNTVHWGLNSFFSSVLSVYTTVLLNDVFLTGKIESVGNLIPAVYFSRNNDYLSFFKNPIDKKTWQIICNYRKRINSTTFNFNEDSYKYWQFLRVCQKSLFEEFSHNNSKSYTALRRSAFSDENFESNTKVEAGFFEHYVSKMPFLALLIFSIYDSGYRNDLLQYAKSADYYNANILEFNDLLIERQNLQDYKKYKAYKRHQKSNDIKNLLVFNRDLNQWELHQTVISEIFEAVSIAEGLIQIIENAVLHANGGLLSMRIYSRARNRLGINRKERHVLYLDKVYGSSFFNSVNADYFLEIQVKDISNLSIPKKFIANVKEEFKDNEDIMRALNQVKGEMNLSYQFNSSKLSEKVKSFYGSYYSIASNLVHHYGLEIFMNILTARKGILAVCGYGDSYSNIHEINERFTESYKIIFKELLDEIEDKEGIQEKVLIDSVNKINEKINGYIDGLIKNLVQSKNLSGTTYSFLLPLNHEVVQCPNISTEYYSNSYINSNDANIISITLDAILQGVVKEETAQAKRQNINCIKNNIDKIFINYKSSSHSTYDIVNFIIEDNEYFEEIIKGIALFILETKRDCPESLGIAIIGLSDFQLINATRILATFYLKNHKEQSFFNSSFDNIQIFLRAGVMKELVFSGSDILVIKDQLLQAAMTNGSFFKELETIIQVLNSMSGGI